jgi:hypothetical protein
MMSIVLVAVMLDRPALTMRNVALAALLILIVSPESLFDLSFEMSLRPWWRSSHSMSGSPRASGPGLPT